MATVFFAISAHGPTLKAKTGRKVQPFIIGMVRYETGYVHHENSCQNRVDGNDIMFVSVSVLSVWTMSRNTKALILAHIVYVHLPEITDQIMAWANDPVIDEMYERELLRMKVGYLI